MNLDRMNKSHDTVIILNEVLENMYVNEEEKRAHSVKLSHHRDVLTPR